MWTSPWPRITIINVVIGKKMVKKMRGKSLWWHLCINSANHFRLNMSLIKHDFVHNPPSIVNGENQFTGMLFKTWVLSSINPVFFFTISLTNCESRPTGIGDIDDSKLVLNLVSLCLMFGWSRLSTRRYGVKLAGIRHKKPCPARILDLAHPFTKIKIEIQEAPNRYLPDLLVY